MTYNTLLKGRVSLPNAAYIVTAVVAGRLPAFRDFAAGVLVAREVRALGKCGACEIVAWVLMPDHLHMIIVPQTAGLAALVQMLKGRTARALNLFAGRGGRFWQRGFHDHALRADEDLVVAARYIVANPLRAGLVKRIGDYPFWDARWV
jgi:REP element-mobilizing transposase RayT